MRLGWGVVVLAVVVQGGAQTAPVPSTGPISSTAQGVTPPVLESGAPSIKVDKLLTKDQEDKLLGDADGILKFVSSDTGLAIKKPVKKVFVSRESVAKELREKFDEDKGSKRMERSELVMKKFGLLDRDFKLRPFLLSLLTEQIAGFYDNKTKTMNLLNWVPVDEQKPVMAHELTHALQDQRVELQKWEDPQPEGVAKNAGEDNLHIQTDEAGTVREAVLEGQAMVSFADNAIQQAGHPGKTIKDFPQMGEMLSNGAGDMSDSPVLARAPLVLQQSMLFPYTAGLAFEQAVLIKAGTQKAFAGMLESPPSSTMEILHPEKYLAHVPVPVLLLPDVHPAMKAAGYEPYDVGVMGELDVRMLAELFGGRPLALALAPNWDGGIYYAAQKSAASDAVKATTASIGLMYLSRWKNEDSARSFFDVFVEELPRQYNGLKRRKDLETDEDERVFSSREGDVLLSRKGNMVWVSEGFDLALAKDLREMVQGVQGTGRTMEARSVGSGEFAGGVSSVMREFGVLRVAIH